MSQLQNSLTPQNRSFDVSRRSTLRSFLKNIQAAPQKRLSQNFLVDQNILQKIADAASLNPGDAVLEIGPGPGALTEELLKTGACVTTVEKDRLFAKELSRLQTNDQRLRIHEADFLDFPLESLRPCKEITSLSSWKVVANLPYHITTPILQKLCQFGSLFSFALVMVQKEMAQRAIAPPGTKDRSAFSIFLQTYATTSLVFSVSRNSFYPAPKVDSSIIRLDFKPPCVEDPESFLAWTRTAFQQRRKMLRSTLAIREEPYASLRPEALSLEAWKELYQKRRHNC